MLLPLLSLSLLMCVFSTGVIASDKQSAQAAIKKATTLLQQSKNLGFEWNTVTPLILQAQDAIKANDFDNATQFAVKASQQAKLSIQQAENEEKNWHLNLPK